MQHILKALELKKELDSLRPLNKDQEEKIMQKFRLDWNYHSNHLEGNSLTFGETRNLILHGITAQGKPLKDHFEITGHNEAINWVIDVVKDTRPLTENFIRELHTLLLKESYYVDAITPDGKNTRKKIEIGKYKTSQNHVQTSTGEIFRFAEPEETPALMHDLLEWYKNKRKESDVNPIILASEFHYKFIRIHPFDDGNGRVSRILMNFILMSFNYPPVIIKTEDKLNYFFALRQADNGEIDFFIDYIGKNLVRSLEIMIAGAKGESIDEPDDLDKSIALLEHKLKGIGKKAEVFRSAESINKVYKNSVKPLIQKLIIECEKFDKLYTDNTLECNYNGDTKSVNKKIFDSGLELLFKKDASLFEIKYHHITFNRQFFQEFNYSTEIRFSFSVTKYSVKNKQQEISKFYDEFLDEKEIESLIKYEAKLHHEHIEYEIKRFEENNKSKP